MESSSNFKLKSKKPLTQDCLNRNLFHFKDVIDYIHQLPYGRNYDRSDFSLVLKEGKGTCSTKHAFLTQVAIENGSNYYQLYLGIYKMNGFNTPGVGDILNKYRLHYIPEAHTYLKDLNSNYLDITRTVSSNMSFKDSIIIEQSIQPKQIGSFILNWHQEFLKSWINQDGIKYTTGDLWDIREECINSLK